MNLRLKKCSALLAVAALTSFLTVNMANATDVNVSNWTALKNAIANNTVSTITLTENIANADSDLPDIASIVLTIDGNNKTIWGTGTKAFEGTYVDLGRTLTIQNISNNTADITKATSGVGGFNNFILNKGTTNISNSYFENNSAVDVDYLRRGGVIHNAAVNGSAFSKVSILNSIFKSNSANLSGGAIYFKSAPTENASELTVGSSSDNTKFEGNHTSYDGGAIYIDSSANAKTVTGSITADFTNNYVSNSDDDAWGGAISINALVGTSISDRYVISGDFTGNYATTTSTNAANGAFGGALSIDNEYGTSSFVAVNGSTFINNYTKATSEKSYGGAIYSSSDLEITGSTFTNNGKKEGNAVTTAGGAIANAGDLKITGSTFTNNAATAYGGAIVNQGTLQITDSSFTGNTAGMSGGAIVNMEDATLTINAQGGNVTFSNNTVNGAPNDIDNSGTLDLNATGVNTITLNGGITGSKGTTNVKTGKTIVSSIEQKALNISNGATLNVNASNISTSTNSITNAGTIELGTGTLENSITGNGTGKTQINGVVTSNAAIQNAIEILNNNKLTIEAVNVGGDIINDNGVIVLTSGNLAHSITGNGTGLTKINGTVNVASNASITQPSLKVETGKSLDNSGTITATLTNNGIISGTGSLTLNGNSTNAANKSITQNFLKINNGVTLDNEGSINAITLTNAGTLNVNAGSGEISQITNTGNVKVNTDYTLTNGITAGTYRDSNKVIIAADKKLTVNSQITNQNIEIAGTGSLIAAANTLTAGKNSITLDGAGLFNINNDTIETISLQDFSAENGATLSFDTDFASAGQQSDLITVAGSVTTGVLDNALKLDNIKIKSDFEGSYGTTKEITLFEKAGYGVVTLSNLNIADGASSIFGANKYTFSQKGNAGDEGILVVTKSEGLTLPEAIGSKGANNNIVTYNLARDLVLEADLGTLTRKTSEPETSREFTISGNNHSVSGNNVYGGVTVNTGDTLNLENLSSFNNFNTAAAVTNNGTLTTNNVLDLGSVVGTGDMYVETGRTVASSITQNSINISQGATLNIAADKLMLNDSTNLVSNLGTIELTDGDLASNISGIGTLSILGAVTNNSNKNITQDSITIAAEKSFSSAVDKLTLGRITNEGNLTLNGGTAEFASNDNQITGTNGQTTFNGKVDNLQAITQAKVINNGTLKSDASNILGAIENSDSAILIFNGGTNNNTITGGTVENSVGKELYNYAGINANVVNAGNWYNMEDSTIIGLITNNHIMSIDADDIRGNVTNTDLFNITDGTLRHEITGIGTTQIQGDVVSTVSIANAINILGTNSLIISASDVDGIVTNNAGTISLNTGTLAYGITGNSIGKTQINGDVTSTTSIANAIEILGTNKLTIDADNVDGNVTNLAGTIKLGNGGLAYNIIGNGTTQIAGDVINNAIMSQNKLVIDADRTLSFANNGKFIIKNNLENSGTFAAKFANIYIGDRDTANIGSITNNAGATMNLDSSGATVDDVAVYAYIYNEGIINMDGSGAFNLYSDIDDGDGNGTLILNESAKVVSYGSIEQNQVTISENAELTNDGSYQGGGTITANSITNSGILTNTGIITAALTNSGTLTSAADKIVGNITNNGTYNVQGGTLNDAITGTGIINLAEDVKLTLGSGASFADGQTFNAGNNSTISLLGAATTATINGLTIADGEHMNLEIDWKDKFNSGGSGITGSGKVLLSTIDLTSTSGLANGSYEFTNLGNKVTLSPIVKLVDNSVGSNAYNSVKYESGSLYGSRTNLASTIQNTATGSSSATVYSMSGNESADNQTVKNEMLIQGNGKTITGSGIIVDAPVTTTIDGLVLKDVNLDGISIDTSARGAIHVKDSSALGVFAVEDDVTIKGTTGATNTAIYLENGTDAELGAAAGRKITISDNIISEHASNNIYLSGLGEIVLSGLLDPATINVGTTTTREAAYAAAGETLTTYDEGIDWNLNAGGSLKYNNDNILYNPAHHTTTALQNTMNLNGGSLDLRNGVANTILLNSDGLLGRVAAGTGLNLSANSNIYLDVDLANKKMDNFGTSSINRTGTAILNVAGLKLISDATETNTDITFIEKSNITGTKDGAVTYSGGTVLTALSPIYRYNVSLNESATEYGFNFIRSGGHEGFNPAILASPIAAQVGSYLTQLNNYEQAFANMDMMMLMTKKQRQAMKFANKYASTQGPAQGGVITYDPNQIPEEEKGLWFRPFATFENVGLKNGPDVGNVAYGSLFGGDSPIIELSHGWDMVYSFYAGYNGSHQTYDGVGIYQNGGTLGGSAAFYKGNFFTGLTANVGANVGSASSMYGNEDFTMLTTGIASKTGYNWELADGKFIIQPNWLMSYSFVNTFDYTNAAGVKINSDPLNAIQIAPGIKFIGNLKNGWQPYASVQMVWNLMDKTKFSANEVSLPELSVKPYVQYGIGLQKRWGERFTAFGQAMIRNGGRNGIALQFGARWTLGKDSSKTKASKAMKQIKEPKLNLSSKK